MSKEILERMAALRKDSPGEVRIVPISKLGENGGDLNLHIHPVTTDEFSKIMKVYDDVGERCVTTIILRARDENGQRIFSKVQKEQIKEEFGPILLVQLEKKINEDFNTLDDATGVEILGN